MVNLFFVHTRVKDLMPVIFKQPDLFLLPIHGHEIILDNEGVS